MRKSRLEAFSDGVLAIVITIMVLELRHPATANLDGIWELRQELASYAVSFAFLGIYWNNHHHLLQTVQHVNGKVLWANMHLLFWLSLIPFATAWAGSTDFAKWPVFVYGLILLLAAIAYFLLSRTLIGLHGEDSALAQAIGKDQKGKISILMYGAALGVSLFVPLISCAIYVLVAIMWIVPDQRIERALK